MPKTSKYIFLVGLMLAFLAGLFGVYTNWHIGHKNGGILLPEGYVFSFLDWLLITILPFVILAGIATLFSLLRTALQKFEWPQSRSGWISFALDFCTVTLSALAVIAAILACFYVRSQDFAINADANDHCVLIQGLGISQPNKNILCWIATSWISYNFIAFLIFLVLMQLPVWGAYFYLRKKFQDALPLNDKEYNLRHLELGRKGLKWMMIYLSVGIFFRVHIVAWAFLTSHNPQGEWCDYVEKSAPYHIYVMDYPCVLQWYALQESLLMLGMFMIPIMLPLLLCYLGIRLLIHKAKA